MTKEQAIAELTRAAEICPTTPLAEACRYALATIDDDKDCGTCIYAARSSFDEPCKHCLFVCGNKWEPKGVDNGQAD